MSAAGHAGQAGLTGQAGAPLRPHDLLWLADGADTAFDGLRPRWATPQWIAAAPAVVRRAAPAADGLIAVGWRGATRSERSAGHVPVAQVASVVTPEAIARSAAWRAVAGASTLPCLRALAWLAPRLDATPFAWGATGGVGFALASGIDVLRADSDLDLLLRVPSAGDAHALCDAARLLADAGCRVDVQIETPCGAFALAEWLRTGGAVLLKTGAGPRLVTDPWQALQASAAAGSETARAAMSDVAPATGPATAPAAALRPAGPPRTHTVWPAGSAADHAA